MTPVNTKRCKIKRMVCNTVPVGNIAYQKFRTCDRKKVYPDMKDGWSAVNFIKANGNDPYPDFELRPYECHYCHQIHVGHSNMPRSSEARLKGQEVGPSMTLGPSTGQPNTREHRKRGLRRKEAQ